MFGLSRKIDQMQQLMQQIDSRIRSEEEQKERADDGIRQIGAQLGQLTEAATKQEMAVEDMLDTLDEWQESQKEQTESLKDRLLEKANTELAEKAEQEGILLEMTISAWDQLFNLQLAAQKAGDEAWTRQLALAGNALAGKARNAGLQQTGCTGEMFSYEVHEAAERAETDQPQLDMTVAEVYSPGYWYRGKCLRKARVAVYRVKQEEEP